jgi:phospholipid transport system substrate-binding protein
VSWHPARPASCEAGNSLTPTEQAKVNHAMEITDIMQTRNARAAQSWRSVVSRRFLLSLSAAAPFLILAGRPALAQDAEATAFVTDLSSQLVRVVNGPAPMDEKRRQIGNIIDSMVDVPTIARFCLGRFWNNATPQQQRDFTNLFHQVLINNITGHLGEYKGVSLTVTTTQERGGNPYVGTIVRRPNVAPATVQWVISTKSGAPKVIDLIAEGTSLRLTQRSDYASYLSRNNNSVDALINALRRQVASTQG